MVRAIHESKFEVSALYGLTVEPSTKQEAILQSLLCALILNTEATRSLDPTVKSQLGGLGIQVTDATSMLREANLGLIEALHEIDLTLTRFMSEFVLKDSK